MEQKLEALSGDAGSCSPGMTNCACSDSVGGRVDSCQRHTPLFEDACIENEGDGPIHTPPTQTHLEFSNSDREDNQLGAMGLVCDVLVDNGACENFVSKAIVNALNLAITKHSNPLKLGWIRKGRVARS